MSTKNKNIESILQLFGRLAGVCIHVSSLPGRHGIGDIADSAFDFVDKLVEMDIGVWQFLPLGPTAYGDSPYQPLSAFAGNANLLGIRPLIELGLIQEAETAPLAELPSAYTDYGRLIPIKRALLEKAAERFRACSGNGLLTEYEEFLHCHGDQWLEDYALFRVLKTGHGERPWPEWDREFVRRDPAALDKLRSRQSDALERTRITQFLFDRQWRALKAYATEKGICLFGDMPIYIALDSADAWAHPELLLIDRDGKPSHVAGVPPDYFSEDGQLWGNPLYDWEYHKRTGFRWWIERMQYSMNQVHLVRIDHFRGFESFWTVPYGANTARKGKWVPGPRDALFEAMRKALGSLPIVAEDLGVITKKVDRLRQNHGIPGMVVLQFEIGDKKFDIGDIGENCVCYTGTHDNDTTLGWFRGNGDDTRSDKEIRRTRARVLKITKGSADTINEGMIRLAFSSKAALAIAPMQDYLGLGSEARLNIPGTTLNNWRWRMIAGQLEDARIASVRAMVQSASRSPVARIDCTA